MFYGFVFHNWPVLLVCSLWVLDILRVRRRVDGGFRRGGYLGRSASTGTRVWTGDVPESIGAVSRPLTSEASSFSRRHGLVLTVEDYLATLPPPSRPTGPSWSGSGTEGLGANGDPGPSAGYGDAA